MRHLRLTPSPDVVGRDLDDLYFLVHVRTQRMFELNATGCRVWALLVEGLDRDAIEARIAKEYNVDAAEVARTVGALIEELLSEGMVVTAPAQAAVESAEHPPATPAIAESQWLLRWEPTSQHEPQVHGAAVHNHPSGTRTVVSGWIDGVPPNRCAAHVAELQARHGLEFVHDIRGAYVVSLWDATRNALVVIRDAAGIAPCYYAWNGRVLLVSSSVDVLLAQPEVDTAPNTAAIAEYVHRRTSTAQVPETMFRDIHRLPPAHGLELRNGVLSTERYWDPVPVGFEWATDAEAARVEDVLEQAVARCQSAGANGIGLSGGFDSVSLAIAAQANAPDAIHALSLRLSGTAGDEGSVQSAVAQALGMRPWMVDCGGELASGDFLRQALALSATSPNPVLSPWQWMYSALLDKARNVGCGGLMLGTGGDEMFIVDPRLAEDLMLRGDFRGLYQFGRAWQRTSPRSGPQVLRELLWKSALRPILRRHALGASRRFRDAAVHWQSGRRWAYGPSPSIVDVLERRNDADRGSLADDAYRGQLRGLLLHPSLLAEFDQAAAWGDAHGVRLHYPYYDRDLVDLALRLHPTVLYRNGRMKSPLRELVSRRLPGVALPRRKVDFTSTANRIFRRTGRRAWEQLGGARRLAELQVVEKSRVDAAVDEYLAGSRPSMWAFWHILSAEAWLQARGI